MKLHKITVITLISTFSYIPMTYIIYNNTSAFFKQQATNYSLHRKQKKKCCCFPATYTCMCSLSKRGCDFPFPGGIERRIRNALLSFYKHCGEHGRQVVFHIHKKKRQRGVVVLYSLLFPYLCQKTVMFVSYSLSQKTSGLPLIPLRLHKSCYLDQNISQKEVALSSLSHICFS